MADAQDLKSWVRNRTCGFESRLRHHSSPIFNSLVFFPQHRFHRFVRQQLGQWFGGLVQHRSRLDGRFN